MSAIGLMVLGFGILTAWAGFNRTHVFDLLRSIVGAPVPARTDHSATVPPLPAVIASATSKQNSPGGPSALPGHRLFIGSICAGDQFSACLWSPPELMNVVSGKPP